MDWMTKTEQENPSLVGPPGSRRRPQDDLTPIYTGSSAVRRDGRRGSSYDDDNDDEDRDAPTGDGQRRRRGAGVRRAINRTARFFKGLNDDEKGVAGVIAIAVVVGVVLLLLRIKSNRNKRQLNREYHERQKALESPSPVPANDADAADAEEHGVAHAVKLANSDCRILYEKMAAASSQDIGAEDTPALVLTQTERARMASHMASLEKIVSTHSPQAIRAMTGVSIDDLMGSVRSLLDMPVRQEKGGSWQAPGAVAGVGTPTTPSSASTAPLPRAAPAIVVDGGRIARRNPFLRPMAE